MTRATHFPFYPSDWLGGVAGMKPAEVGVYINIIAMIYDAGGPIKLDEARLARRMCCPLVTFRSILLALIEDEKLSLNEGYITQQRAEIELEKLGQKRLSASASAASRWQEKPNKSTGAGMRSHSVRNANQSQSQSYKKEEDKSSSKEKRGSRLPAGWAPSQDEFEQALKIGLTQQEALNETDRFRDYWISKAGAAGVKLDWSATWRNWCRSAKERSRSPVRVVASRDQQKSGSRLDAALRLVQDSASLSPSRRA